MQKIKGLPWRQIFQTLQDYLMLTLGALLLAASVNVFLVPNEVISLGFTGLGMLANILWSWPIGVVTLVLNLPLLFAGIKWGGGVHFALRTVYTVVMMTLAIDLLAPVLPQIREDPLIYTLFGGLLNGLGTGLILRGQGTAGGTDIIAQLMNRMRGIPYGQIYMIANLIILMAAAFVVGLVPVLYAIIVVFVSGRVVDTIQEGAGYGRAVFIISEQPVEVRQAVIEDLGRGVTVIPSEGGYTHAPRSLLFVVVARAQVTRLKRIVVQIDPQAFIVVSDAREVLGKGFRPAVEV